MQLNEAFGIITDKLGAVLTAQGYQKAKVESSDDNELVALFVSENVAYSVIYYKDRMHTLLRECPMTDDGPDNDWKTLATWMFDPAVNDISDVNSISNDFIEAVSAPKAINRAKQTKKSKGKKKDDDGNADPVFLAKRFVPLFPELKDEIILEEDSYYPFRGVTFTRASIVPKVNELVKTGSDANLKKLGSILSAQYVNGDADTRSIITMVILNSIPEEYDEKIDAFLSDDLKKSAKYARKLRGKNIKPEVEKKPKQTVAQRLEKYNKR